MGFARLLPLLSFVALTSPVSSQQSTAGITPPSALDSLESIFGLDEIPADHIIVIDLSGSMKWEPVPGSRTNARAGQRRFDLVMDALPDLLDAIPQGDYIRVLGFHDFVIGADNNELVRDDWPGASSTPAFLESIEENLQIGNDTDFGYALDEVLDVLTRQDHHAFQYVYFLSDGEHDPPMGSVYAGPLSSSEWTTLSAIWDGLFASTGSPERRVLKLFLFGLFDVNDSGILGELFSEQEGYLRFLKMTQSADLEAYFSEIRSNLRHELIRASIEQQRNAGSWLISCTTTTSVQPPCTLSISVRSTFDRMPSSGTLAVETIEGGDGLTISLLDPVDICLAPESSASVRALVSYEQSRSPFLTFRNWASSPASFLVAVINSQLEPADLMDAEGFRDLEQFQVQVDTTRFQLIYKTGTLSRWVLLIPGILLLASVYLVFRLLPRSITGKLRWRDVPAGEECPPDVRFKGKGSVRIDSSDDSVVRNVLLPSSFIIIRCRAQGLFGTRNVIEVCANGVILNGKPKPSGSSARLKGNCIIQIDETVIMLESVKSKLCGG